MVEESRACSLRVFLSGSVVAFVILVAFRLPYLFGDFLSIDEAVYAAIADQMLDGAIPYRDSWERHPPVILWFYAGVFLLERSMAAVHLAMAILLAATCGLQGLLFARLLGEEPRHGRGMFAASFLALFLNLYHVNEFLAANTEMLMVFFLNLGLWQWYRGWERGRLGAFAWSGVFLGLAVQCKQVGLLNAAVLIAVTGLWEGLDAAPDRRWRKLLTWTTWKRTTSVTAGFVASNGAIAGSFAAHGALGDMIFQNYGINLLYIQAGVGGSTLTTAALRAWQVIGPHLLLWAGGVIGMVGLAFHGTRTHGLIGLLRSQGALWIPWTAVSMFAVSVGGRFFGHYFIQPLPPLALLTCWVVVAGWSVEVRRVAARMGLRVTLAGALLVGSIFPLMEYPRFPRVSKGPRLIDVDENPMAFYTPLWQRLLPQIGTTYLSRFQGGWRLPSRDERLARAIQAMTGPEDTIFVWGFYSQIYWLSNRLCGTRFTFTDFMTPHEAGSPPDPSTVVPGALELLVEDLNEKRPAVIVDSASGDYFGYGRFPMEDYPPLWEVVQRDYVFHGVIEGYDVYRRRRIRFLKEPEDAMQVVPLPPGQVEVTPTP